MVAFVVIGDFICVAYHAEFLLIRYNSKSKPEI